MHPSRFLLKAPLIFLIAFLPATPVAFAEDARLVRDIRTSISSSGYEVGWVGSVDDTVLMVAGDGSIGREVMRLEEDHLVPMTDLCPGSCSTFSRAFDLEVFAERLTFFRDELVFVPTWLEPGLPPEGLWKISPNGSQAIPITSDENVLRPVSLGDDYLLFNSSFVSQGLVLNSWDGQNIRQLTEPSFRDHDLVVNGSRAFFYTGTSPSRLFTSDGLTTRLVTEIPGSIHQIYPLNDGVLIDVGYGSSLWLSDGTESGTRELIDFPQQSGFFASAPGRYYFSQPVNNGGDFQFWTTDGTPSGSRYLPQYCSHPCPSPEPVVTPAGLLLFFGEGDPNLYRSGLWRTDGTVQGTYQLSQVGPSRNVFGTQQHSILVGDRIFFIGDLDDHLELWVSDGTRGGTRKVQDVDRSVRLLGAAGDRAIFITYDEDHVATLWSSDGSSTGTRALKTTLPDVGQPNDSWAHSFGEYLLLTLREERNVERIWRTDGTLNGTVGFAETAARSWDSDPEDLTVVGDRLYFVATADDKRGLWSTQGSTASTQAVEWGLPSNPKILGSVGEKVLVYGASQLWVTDRTGSGTTRLAYLNAISNVSVRSAALGNRFVITDSFNDSTDLWLSDGTLHGTRKIAHLPNINHLNGVFSAGSQVFLQSRVEGSRLWRTDGTEEGTYSMDPGLPLLDTTVLGEKVFFRLNFRLGGSDGTPEGTRELLGPENFPGFGSGISKLYPAAEDQIYFTSGISSSERILWAADGELEDIREVGRLLCAGCDYSPQQATPLGNQLVFVWEGLGYGEELWIADPTSGIRRIKDICAGACSSGISNLTTIGDKVYFSASDGVNGTEPWVSDGTAAGTYRLTDAAPGAVSSEPSEFILFKDEIYFQGYHPKLGTELWATDATAGASATLNEDRFEVLARWRTEDGEGSAGMAPFSTDTGFFWFFGSDNIELVVKVLDGRPINGHYWIFYGALSQVEYWIDVRDRLTGTVKTYYNPPGEGCGRTDTEAFAGESLLPAEIRRPDVGLAGSTSAASTPKTGLCTAGEDRLCLQDGRFLVEVEWSTSDGGSGVGRSIVGTDETGYFWFFDPANVELAVKVLDGRPINGKFWVFYGALSDVQYDLSVTDLVTGEEVSYFNPQGEACGRQDIDAF